MTQILSPVDSESLSALRVDYVNGYDIFDGILWFFDGAYVGRDDRLGPAGVDLQGRSHPRTFQHRSVIDAVTAEDIRRLPAADSLSDISHPLNREDLS